MPAIAPPAAVRRVPWALASLVASLCVGHCAHAAPLDRSVVPADPAILVHIDVEQADRSEFGRLVIERRAHLNVLAGLEGLKAFGIDPFKDFKGVTVFVPRGKPDGGVVVIRSTGAVDALWNHLKTEPHAKALTVNGQELQSWEDNGRRKYGVVRRGKGENERAVYVSDDWDALATALNVADGKAASDAGKEAASPRAGSMVFMDMREVPADMHRPGDLPAAALFGGLRAAVMDLGDAPAGAAGSVGARVVMTYDSPETAADMQRVGEGLRALARLAARNAPETAPLTGAAEPVKVQAAENRLTLEAAWTTEQAVHVLGFLTHMHGQPGPGDHGGPGGGPHNPHAGQPGPGQPAPGPGAPGGTGPKG